MALKQDIIAVQNNAALSAAEKAAQIDKLIVDAYLPILQAREGQNYTRGDVTVTLVRAWEWVENGRSWLAVHIFATRNGVRVDVNNPLLFRNPPIGENGDTADLIAWGQQIILDAVGG